MVLTIQSVTTASQRWDPPARGAGGTRTSGRWQCPDLPAPLQAGQPGTIPEFTWAAPGRASGQEEHSVRSSPGSGVRGQPLNLVMTCQKSGVGWRLAFGAPPPWAPAPHRPEGSPQQQLPVKAAPAWGRRDGPPIVLEVSQRLCPVGPDPEANRGKHLSPAPKPPAVAQRWGITQGPAGVDPLAPSR